MDRGSLDMFQNGDFRRCLPKLIEEVLSVGGRHGWGVWWGRDSLDGDRSLKCSCIVVILEMGSGRCGTLNDYPSRIWSALGRRRINSLDGYDIDMIVCKFNATY